MGSPERSNTFERMKAEYEKLYSEFLTKSIKAYKEKQALQQQLNRVGVIHRMLSQFVCDKQCLQSWTDRNKFDAARFKKIACVAAILIVVVFMLSVF